MVRQANNRTKDDAAHIEVLSNLSLSLDRLAGFCLVLSTVTLLVALWPTVMGYWPIMAVAVIHLAIVGWCFRLAWLGHWARQDIHINETTTSIEHCSKNKRQRIELPTQWLRVILDRTGMEPRLFLAAHDQRFEIGAFLPADERVEAAAILRRSITDFSAWKRPPESA